MNPEIESKLQVLGTGSKGNSYIFNKYLMLDCGVAYKHLKPYLDEVKVIFISHEHGDHLNKTAVRNIAKNYPNIKFVVGYHLVEKLKEQGVTNILEMEEGKIYNFGKFKLSVVVLYHDCENYGLRIIEPSEDYKAIYLTDTGHLEGITFKDYDLVIIEYNHDEIEVEEHIQKQEDEGVDFIYEKGSRNIHLSMQKADKAIEENAKNGTEIVKVHLTHRYNPEDYNLHYIYKEKENQNEF